MRLIDVIKKFQGPKALLTAKITAQPLDMIRVKEEIVNDDHSGRGNKGISYRKF